jgi:hypothetical protein
MGQGAGRINSELAARIARIEAVMFLKADIISPIPPFIVLWLGCTNRKGSQS